MISPVRVTGLSEIEQKLIALGDKRGTAVLRRSMLKAAQPIVEQAKANIASRSKGSGALHKSMGARFSTGAKSSGIGLPALGRRFTVQIAPLRSDRTAVALYNLAYRRRAKQIFHGHLIEFGFTSRSGRRVAGQPFLRPALDSRSTEAIQMLADQLRLGIERLLKQ